MYNLQLSDIQVLMMKSRCTPAAAGVQASCRQGYKAKARSKQSVYVLALGRILVHTLPPDHVPENFIEVH